MTDKIEPTPKYKIGQFVFYIDDEYKVKKYKVCSIRILVTKHILNTPFMKQADNVEIYYHLVNEHGYDVKSSYFHNFPEYALFADEYSARMTARHYLNNAIMNQNDKMIKIKKIAQTNNSRIGKLEKKHEEKM